MAKKLLTEFIKVATAGKTVDDRTIQEQWLLDAAETYDRKEYTADIFLDHVRYYGSYGEVVELKTERDEKNRLCLYATMEPTGNLMELTRQGQYKHPSVYIIPNFAGSGKAYLGHLAAVKEPASIGTEQLKFSAKDGTEQNGLAFTCEDPFELQLQDEGSESEKITTLLKSFFSNNIEEEDMKDKKALKELQAKFGVLSDQLSALKTPTATDENSGAPATEFNADAFNNLITKVDDLAKQIEASNDKKEPESDDKFSKLETQFSDLKTLIDDALAEQQGTNTNPNDGNESSFQMV